LPEAGPLFAVTVQRHLVELDCVLAEHGGLARAGWNDIYIIGPPEHMFSALDQFWDKVGKEIGLVRQKVKCKVFTGSTADPEGMPDHIYHWQWRC